MTILFFQLLRPNPQSHPCLLFPHLTWDSISPSTLSHCIALLEYFNSLLTGLSPFHFCATKMCSPYHSQSVPVDVSQIMILLCSKFRVPIFLSKIQSPFLAHCSTWSAPLLHLWPYLLHLSPLLTPPLPNQNPSCSFSRSSRLLPQCVVHARLAPGRPSPKHTTVLTLPSHWSLVQCHLIREVFLNYPI